MLLGVQTTLLGIVVNDYGFLDVFAPLVGNSLLVLGTIMVLSGFSANRHS